MATERLLTPLLYAGYPVIYIRTQEQERSYEKVVAEIKDDSALKNLPIYLWKSNIGLVKRRFPVFPIPHPHEERVATAFQEALQYTITPEQEVRLPQEGEEVELPSPRADTIYFFMNPKPHLGSARANPTPAAYNLIQTIRDAAIQLRVVGSYIIFIGSDIDLPPELTDIVTFVDFPLPTKEEIRDSFSRVISGYSESLKVEIPDDVLENAADSMVGIPLLKAENAIALSLAKSKGLDLDLLQSEKEQIIRQSGVLQWIRTDETMDNLGGYDVLKADLLKRVGYFSHRRQALEFGLRPPKGIMLVGLPGTGKSLAAEAIAHVLQLRLYSFDLAAVYKGIVGASEENVRIALRMAEALAPCCLRFDEFEKAAAGLESSGRTDSGVSSRVIGTILTWMQECKLPIYKIATCNSIRNLDAAIFRRGRWDNVYGVELPSFNERKEIYAIHLRKRHRDPANFDLEAIAKVSKDFVGSEIESTVDDALYAAFHAGRDIETKDIVDAVSVVKPLAVTDREGIEWFQGWVKDRAVSVSSEKGRDLSGKKTPAVVASRTDRVIRR